MHLGSEKSNEVKWKDHKTPESSIDEAINYGVMCDHRVPHIHTRWDCGLACVVMVLRGVGIDCTLEYLTSQCGLESIWTIDLAFLLCDHVKDFTYYTSYFGSRKEHQDTKFYQDNFDEDEKRGIAIGRL
ncbi:hypothetical protein DFQ30_008263 [Apophysomyces sp. BC1015]|nr:hypothetical protein DFQ30_008263 [Apophysomyces sp. BC1015]KAG0174956.1 hypothetical protein DFQ29_007312 [Apophysomyces sp. BC1021]